MLLTFARPILWMGVVSSIFSGCSCQDSEAPEEDSSPEEPKCSDLVYSVIPDDFACPDAEPEPGDTWIDEVPFDECEEQLGVEVAHQEVYSERNRDALFEEGLIMVLETNRDLRALWTGCLERPDEPPEVNFESQAVVVGYLVNCSCAMYERIASFHESAAGEDTTVIEMEYRNHCEWCDTARTPELSMFVVLKSEFVTCRHGSCCVR